jgi:hypothetical protein
MFKGRHPSYTHELDYDRDLLERDFDEELSGREYPSDAYVNLEARQPSFFSGLFHDVGKVAHVAEKVSRKPNRSNSTNSSGSSHSRRC